MKRFSLAMVCAVLASLAVAAQQQIEMQQQVQRAGPGDAERPKPSPEMQKRGYEVLQMAEAGANGLEGGMRAFALLQVARGYEPTDKKKAVELLESAFTSTRSVDDDKAHTRQTLQVNILRELTQLAPESVEQHVGEMSPGMWKNQVLSGLLGYYEKQKQLDKAEQMIYRLGSEQEIPYDAVQKVIHALPPEENADAQQLFAASLASYRNHKHPGDTFSTSDFPDLILRSWKRLPPQMVHEAIDEVLAQSDPANQDGKQQPFNMNMVSDKGAVAFNSMYQWRLFQLLPVLREIDSSEADELLKKSREVQTLLDKYPQGMNSLGNPDQDEEGGGKGKSHGSMSFSVGGGSGGGGRPQGPSPMEMQRAEKIISDAEKHPAEALANAQTISDPQMKSGALLSIARSAAKKDPATAHSALNKLLDMLPQMENGEVQLASLRGAGEVYLLMDEKDDAKKVVEQGLKAADKMFRQDSEGDDPNQALKAYWPSTEAYRGMMRLAARISPVWAVSLLKDLPDNDVKVVAETALAAAWLDVPAGATIVMTSNKKGTSMSMSDDSR